MKKYNIEFFDKALIFIRSVAVINRALLLAKISSMSEDISSVETKLLKSPIKELKYKKYRLLFFINKNTIYFVSGFTKETQKTPPKELEHAYRIYLKFK